MSYIGQQPLNNFVTKQSQTFSPDGSSTAFTLNFSVTSGVDIMLVINNVVQEPGAGKAYTASGTTLTMSEAPGASDSMYCIFLGLALQTVNPGDGSVGTSKLVDSAITTAKLNSSLDLSSKTITLATNMTNSPSFLANISGHGTATDNSDTVIQFDTEVFDIGSCFNTSTYKFTPNVSGKYFFHLSVGIDINGDAEKLTAIIHKNGSVALRYRRKHDFDSANQQQTVSVSGILTANGSTDYFEALVQQNSGSDRTIRLETDRTHFQAYKLIGV